RFSRDWSSDVCSSDLSQILSIYGTRVQRGEWRDYALDSTYDTAMFSIFRSSNEKPAFVVTKTVPRNQKKQAKFSVFTDDKALIRSEERRVGKECRARG